MRSLLQDSVNGGNAPCASCGHGTPPSVSKGSEDSTSNYTLILMVAIPAIVALTLVLAIFVRYMRWSRRQPQPAAGAGHDEKDAAPEVAQRPLSIPIVIWQPDNSVALASAATVAAAAGTPPIGCSLTAAEGLEVKDGVSELSVGSSSGRSTPAGDLTRV